MDVQLLDNHMYEEAYEYGEYWKDCQVVVIVLAS